MLAVSCSKKTNVEKEGTSSRKVENIKEDGDLVRRHKKGRSKAPGIATRNKGLTTRNKKLVETIN